MTKCDLLAGSGVQGTGRPPTKQATPTNEPQLKRRDLLCTPPTTGPGGASTPSPPRNCAPNRYAQPGTGEWVTLEAQPSTLSMAQENWRNINWVTYLYLAFIV